jgi:4-amino-4-deoxy-L-arabinose transferase-like glycosyltransferase
VTGQSSSAPSPEVPAPASTGRQTGRSTQDPGRRHTRAGRIAERLRRLGAGNSRIPRAALVCALIAIVNAACWSLITPPFQAPDEPSHFAYAQLLAEAGQLPSNNRGDVSQEEETVVRALNQTGIQWHPEVRSEFSPQALHELHEALTFPFNRVGPGGAGVAASEPPLYYALATIPYHLASSGTLLDRLEAMRLLSTLMAGLTALFAFLFVRELLPGVRWAWVVAGLGVALTPVLAFTSGAVTPDAMLSAVSAAAFYCLACAFRRGLTRRWAVAIGAVTAIGFLTKLNFIGLAPGVMVGLVVLGFRGVREHPGSPRVRRAFGSMAIAMGVALTPVGIYVAGNLLGHHSVLGLVSRAARETGARRSPLHELEYMWQFYLPRLPGMVSYFPGVSSFRQLWFARAVGLYGWLDTTFPVWVYNLALVPATLIALLAARTLLVRRTALRRRLGELAVYVAMAVGLLALIAADSYNALQAEGPGYIQPRYLLPLLPLAAAVLAAGARGAGRRLGPAVGALIVTLFLAHDLFSQLLVVARFYG